MKLIVKELEALTSIDAKLNLDLYVDQDASDLEAINDVAVKGKIRKMDQTVILDVIITAQITQKCAITLKPVVYPFETEVEIIFSDDVNIMDYQIEPEIDLDQIIFAYIMSDKPLYVYSEDADHSQFEEATDEGHPAFKELKDKYKT